MKTRILWIAAAVALLATLPVLAEESQPQPAESNEAALEQVVVAEEPVAPAEAMESCEAVERSWSTGPFEEVLASLASHCSGTTDCGRPFHPYWNAYCNNWCQSMGYVGGACGHNRCCLCITS